MTDIEFSIPYADLRMNNFPQGAIASNKTTKINLETDFVDTGSINFPVYDETLLDVHEVGEDFDLAKAKVQVGTFAEFQDGAILVQIRLHNTNSLDNSQFQQIRIFGAGSDGVLREAEKFGGQCQPPLVGGQRLDFILERIGPNQMISCNVKFSEIPANMDNFHIWFTLYERTLSNEFNIVESGTFRFDTPSP
jgi:hypothetical protein